MVSVIKRLGLAFVGLLALAGSALADCNGQFQPGNLCANGTGSVAAVKETAPSAWLDRAFSTSPGTILNRGSSLWAATATPILGNPGAVLGSLGFANNLGTGVLTISPPSSGALGTNILTLPNATDTLLGRTTTDTLTNKTLTSSTDVLGGVTMTLGSDATGDIYYRSSGGLLTRLGIGSTGRILSVSGGLPAWQSFSSLCTAASASVLGCVQGDGATLSISGPGVISINLANANTWTATQTFNPPNGTPPVAALVTNGTATGGSGGSFAFNTITATNSYTNTGTTLDSNGLLPFTAALFINMQNAVATGTTVPSAILAVAHGTGNTPNLVGGSFIATTAVGSGNASFLWGGIGYTNAMPGANILGEQAVDCESAAASGVSILYRFGCTATSFGPTQATNLDAAFVAMQSFLPSQTGYLTSAPFKNFLVMFDGYAGGPAFNPIDPTGSVLTAAGVGNGTFTVANIINLPNVTVTGSIIKTANFQVGGAAGSVGIGTAAAPAAPTMLLITNTSSGNISATVETNGTANFDGFQIEDSSTVNNLALITFETGNTNVSFGQINGNGSGLSWSKVVEANGLGLMVGTFGAVPLIIGTNNTAWLNLSSAGAFAFSGPITETINQNAATLITVSNNSIGTAAINGLSVSNSANTATFGLASTGYTGHSILQNRAFVFGASGVSGSVIDNQGAAPILFGISDTEVGRWDASTAGQLDLGVGGATQGVLALFNSTAAGATKLATANVSSSNFTATLPANTGTLAELNIAQTFTTLQSVSLNSGTPAVAADAGTVLYGVGANGANDTGLELDQYGGAAVNTAFVGLRSARGTAAGPTATQTSDTIGGFRFFGYTGTVFYKTAALFVVANEAFSGTAGGADLQWFTTANTTHSLSTAVVFKASGGLSIGSTNDPGAGGLYVNGATITLNALGTDATHTDRTVCQDTTSKNLLFGSGAAGICLGTSSERFKHDIEPLTVGLQQIMHLQAVSYRLNADHGDPDKVLYGFTAEQGETTLPELVGMDNLGRPQTFDYMGVVPVLVKAIQQLKVDNDHLRTELEQRRSK